MFGRSEGEAKRFPCRTPVFRTELTVDVCRTRRRTGEPDGVRRWKVAIAARGNGTCPRSRGHRLASVGFLSL